MSREEADIWGMMLLEHAAALRFGDEGSTVRRFWRRGSKHTIGVDALRELAAGWKHLSDAQRDTAACCGERHWETLLLELMTHAEAGVRESIAHVIGDLGDPGHAVLLGELMHDRAANVRIAGERALLRLCLTQGAANDRACADVLGEWRAHEPGCVGSGRGLLVHGEGVADVRDGSSPRGGNALAEVLGQLLKHSDARVRRSAAGGVMVLGCADASRVVAQAVKTSHEGALTALRMEVRRGVLPLARRRALEWLTIGELRDAAVGRLSRGGGGGEHEYMLRASHLMLRPARSVSVRGIALRRGAGFDERPTPGASMIAELSQEAVRGLPRWVAQLRSEGGARRAALEGLLAHEDAVARFGAVRASSPAGREDWCFDRDERVAAHALLGRVRGTEWTRGWRGEEAMHAEHAASLRRLLRSSHERVRVLAAEELRRMPGWEQATPGVRLALRRWWHEDRAACERALRARLTHGEAAVRLSAVLLVRALGLAPEFEREVIVLAAGAGEDARVAATAVAALGTVRGRHAVTAASACARHGDDRVRANAVEALVRVARADKDEPGTTMLVEMKLDPHHRVRANVLRGEWLGVIQGDAPRDLHAMLEDERPKHRLAGAWLAGRCMPDARAGDRWSVLASRISEMAHTDPAEEVRRRAAASIARVQAALGMRRGSVEDWHGMDAVTRDAWRGEAQEAAA